MVMAAGGYANGLACRVVRGSLIPVSPEVRDWNDGRFEWDKALFLAKASQLIYWPSRVARNYDDLLRQQTNFTAGTMYRFHTRSAKSPVDTQGCLLTNHNAVIVLFAGTEPFDFVDWLTDLHIDLAELCEDGANHGRWHCGFARAVDAVLNRLLVQLNGADEQQMLPIYVAGHSLGGALAMVAAVRLLQSGVSASRLHVYTFGQPRVGDAEFSAYYDRVLGEQTFRIVNVGVSCDDIVQHLPLEAWGYKHAGNEVKQLVSQDPRELLDSIQWHNPATKLLHDIIQEALPPWMTYHFPELYVQLARR